MAVKECKDCGGKVSKSAKACPHCGSKQPKSIGIVGWLFLIFVVLPIAWNIGSAIDGGDLPSEIGKNQDVSSEPKASEEADPKPEPEPETEWNYYSFTDDMTGEEVSVATLKSDNSVRFEFPYNKAGGSSLSLSFRKRNGKLDAYLRIERGQMMCGYSSCNFLLKIGEGSVQEWTGLRSSTGESDIMFVRDASQLSKIVEQGKPIKIGIDFYRSGSKTFQFSPRNYKPLE
ncbi:hypothetical protein [Marinobacter adhaerens]|uniref:hypothetical protein n=1 Tax=Marinobacter adhaerens TaxID=1033846 RepID=UPI003BAC1C32|nr:hypothetical protein [Marinobacter adhaerens]